MAPNGIDTSLRTEDLLKDVTNEQSSAPKETMSSKELSIDLSIDLGVMLQEIQDERDSEQMYLDPNGCSDCESDGSISLGLSIEGESDKFDVNAASPLHMNSKLRSEDSWWNSNSSAFRDGLDSFRKKMESSFQNLKPYQRRRKSIDHHDDHEASSPRSDAEPSPWPQKTVRFKKFDTVFPFYKSFSRLHKYQSEDEAETNH